MKLNVGLSLLLLSLFLVPSYAIKIQQSISPDGVSRIEIAVSKEYDSNFVNIGTLCKNMSYSPFHSLFSDTSCKDEGDAIVISGVRKLSKADGFNAYPSVFESKYNFTLSGNFLSGLVAEDSIGWGAVPLTVSFNSLTTQGIVIPYVLEMPGTLTSIRNGDPLGKDKVKADLIELFIAKKTLSVESNQTNWKAFATLIIMLVMSVGILVVWVSYFYLKSKF